MPRETGEIPTVPPPNEVSRKTPKPGDTQAISNPDLLDRLQSEAARTRGAKQAGQIGNSHT
ncbi:MAG: hypothetical protein M1405_01505 [Patescibacteria group bacterium]|nr:hypothetical protein [Patescibacteria group bacterium]